MCDYKNEEWLRQKYLVEKLTSEQIGEKCGVNSQTILNWMTRFGIETRKNQGRAPVRHINTCKFCGKQFEVNSFAKHNPENKRKFKRCCSKECTASLRSNYLKERHDCGDMDSVLDKQRGIMRRTIDKDTLVRLFCYEHKHLTQIAKELTVKVTVLRREMERHQIGRTFYRECPQCGEAYSCPYRSMVDPNSNKFKKFCTRKCFLSSRKQCDTWIETQVKEYLDTQGVQYDDQVPIDRMTVDIAIKDTPIVVEVNGDFWHANPAIYGNTKPLHKIHPRVIAKDKRKLEQLKQKGYNVFVVWEDDLLNNKEQTLEALYHKIKDAI